MTREFQIAYIVAQQPERTKPVVQSSLSGK
jgi:hypothetical protein